VEARTTRTGRGASESVTSIGRGRVESSDDRVTQSRHAIASTMEGWRALCGSNSHAGNSRNEEKLRGAQVGKGTRETGKSYAGLR
jgi:hypothetical protein